MRDVRSAVRELLRLLPAGARTFLRGYQVVSALLALLDLAALALMAAAVPALLGTEPFSLPLVGSVGVSPLVMIVGVVAVIALKGVLAIGLHWLLTRRFAQYELAVGDQLLAAYLTAPWQERSRYNSAVLVRIADSGIANTIMGVLLPVAQVPAEVATFTAVVLGVLVLDPTTALISFAYLAVLALVLVRALSRHSVVAGRVNRDYAFRTATLLTEAIAMLKVVTLRRQVDDVLALVHANRVHTARARANISFLSVVPRYVMEMGLVLGFLVVGGAAYLLGDPATAGARAATAVSLFAVVGFRLVPSLTRMQAILTQTASNLPHARSVLDDIAHARSLDREVDTPDVATLDPDATALQLVDVTYRYPDSPPAVLDLSLEVAFGRSLAITGPSGSGKSTLVDLMLGLLEPTSGTLSIGGTPLPAVMHQWRARVGYVPQDVVLIDATIGQNVALSWGEDYDRDRAAAALRRAQATDLLEGRGLDARTGEGGVALSGGQRQRIGIARALYQDPLVLVLDEATSALDGETEARIAEAVAALAGEVTVVTIAHRLATIRDYDQVCVLEQGRLLGVGTFAELVRTSPSFATQARRAGLLDDQVPSTTAPDDAAAGS